MNDLIKQQIPSITESINIGKVFFESGLFADLKSAAQAVVKIQAGAEIGIPPFAALSGIHIILGKPVLGAGIIASKIKSSGKYDYDVIVHTEKLCSIDFYQGKKKLGTSAFTIEDAKKANTKNIDKFPKNMLFARCISNGVKWFCPDVFNGPVYTPEEMETEDVAHEEVKTNGQAEDKVKEAIDKLQNCNSIDDLKMFKSILDADVIANSDFITAGITRFNELNNATKINSHAIN